MTAMEEFRGRWIPVTEELPDDDRDVLISVKSERFPTIGYLDTFRSRMDDRKQYTAWTDGRGFIFRDEEVTAWMELPDKYEEGQEE